MPLRMESKKSHDEGGPEGTQISPTCRSIKRTTHAIRSNASPDEVNRNFVLGDKGAETSPEIPKDHRRDKARVNKPANWAQVVVTGKCLRMSERVVVSAELEL